MKTGATKQQVNEAAGRRIIRRNIGQSNRTRARLYVREVAEDLVTSDQRIIDVAKLERLADAYDRLLADGMVRDVEFGVQIRALIAGDGE